MRAYAGACGENKNKRQVPMKRVYQGERRQSRAELQCYVSPAAASPTSDSGVGWSTLLDSLLIAPAYNTQACVVSVCVCVAASTCGAGDERKGEQDPVEDTRI